MIKYSKILLTAGMALAVSIPGHSSNEQNQSEIKKVSAQPVAVAQKVNIDREDWPTIHCAFQNFAGIELQESAIEPIQQGLSGARLWTINHEGKKYVLRIGADFIAGNGTNELNATKAASECGYGPFLHYCDESKKVIILEHINNDMSFVDVKNLKANPLFHVMGARALAGLHKAKIDLAPKNIFQWLDQAEQNLKKLGAMSTLLDEKDIELYQASKKLLEQVFLNFEGDMAAVHHDPNPRNFLMNTNRAWIIDWETVSKDYYQVDIAVFINFFVYDEARIPALLAAYYGRPASEIESAKLQLMRPMAAFLHSFWLAGIANAKKVPDDMPLLPHLVMKGMVRGGEFKLATVENKFAFAVATAREGLRLLRSPEHQTALDFLSKK